MVENSKSVNEWTRKEFEALPHREWNQEMTCDSIIIMPATKPWYFRIQNWWARKFKHQEYDVYPIHDSGYMCMDFIAVCAGVPNCRLAGCSDVVHIDGIGGYGHNWLEKFGTVPDMVPPGDWSIDCLRTSGFLQLFCRKKILVGMALSSFEIYAVKEVS